MAGMMRKMAELLVPRLTWDDATGFGPMQDRITQALALGVGGFLLSSGEQEAVRTLVRDLRRRSKVPLLIGADGERGAGQVFIGATGLPPMAALGALDDDDAIRRAARLTAREARTIGVNWMLAPVCDLDLLENNPILGTRSLGRDPARVGQLAAEWIDACQAEGVLACAKHFPGHGRTAVDSHLARPVVTTDEASLRAVDLVPFRMAVDAGVASVMAAHVAFPAFDPSGDPATLSAPMLRDLLREEFAFDGLIVTDAFSMAGGRGELTEPLAAVKAFTAGADLLLAPELLDETSAALEAALADGTIDRTAVDQALRRRRKWAQWATPPSDFLRPAAADIAWGGMLADRVLQVTRGSITTVRAPLEIVVVDDEASEGGTAASREPLFAALRLAGVPSREVPRPIPGARGSVIIALFGETRAKKGRTGYAATTLAAVQTALDAAQSAQRDAIVVQFAHPRLVTLIPGTAPVLSAWGGDGAMQGAVARWLAARRAGSSGPVPVVPGSAAGR
jgi:beta-glucosidase